MSRCTSYLLILMSGGALAWLLAGRATDPQRAAFDLGCLLGVALSLTLAGGLDLIDWFTRRRELRRRSQAD